MAGDNEGSWGSMVYRDLGVLLNLCEFCKEIEKNIGTMTFSTLFQESFKVIQLV